MSSLQELSYNQSFTGSLPLAVILQNIQSCIPVAHVNQPAHRDIDICGFGGKRNVWPRIDKLPGNRRDPVSDFPRGERILDIKHPDPGIVVRRKNGLLAAETAGTILMKVVGPERAKRAKISIFRRRECRD